MTVLYLMNSETGEIFETKREAIRNFIEDYDGGDPTNGVRFWDMYEGVEVL